MPITCCLLWKIDAQPPVRGRMKLQVSVEYRSQKVQKIMGAMERRIKQFNWQVIC